MDAREENILFVDTLTRLRIILSQDNLPGFISLLKANENWLMPGFKDSDKKLMHLVAQHNAIKIMSHLLQKPKELTGINILTRDRITSLHLAIRYAHVEMVEILIKNGADLTIKYFPSYDYNNPRNKGLEIINIKCVDRSKENPIKTIVNKIILAIKHDELEIIKGYLVNKTWKRLPLDHHGDTLIHYAALYSAIKIAKYLLELDPELVNEKRYDRATPLHLVALSNQGKEIAKLFIDYRADLTSIMTVRRYSDVLMLTCFDLNIKKNDYEFKITSLQEIRNIFSHAVKMGDLALIKKYVTENHSWLSVPLYKGSRDTILEVSISNKNLEVLEFSVNMLSSIHNKSISRIINKKENDESLIVRATKENANDIVKWLHEKGAQLSQMVSMPPESNYYSCPLLFFAMIYNPPIFEYLLPYADVTVKVEKNDGTHEYMHKVKLNFNPLIEIVHKIHQAILDDKPELIIEYIHSNMTWFHIPFDQVNHQTMLHIIAIYNKTNTLIALFDFIAEQLKKENYPLDKIKEYVFTPDDNGMTSFDFFQGYKNTKMLDHYYEHMYPKQIIKDKSSDILSFAEEAKLIYEGLKSHREITVFKFLKLVAQDNKKIGKFLSRDTGVEIISKYIKSKESLEITIKRLIYFMGSLSPQMLDLYSYGKDSALSQLVTMIMAPLDDHIIHLLEQVNIFGLVKKKFNKTKYITNESNDDKIVQTIKQMKYYLSIMIHTKGLFGVKRPDDHESLKKIFDVIEDYTRIFTNESSTQKLLRYIEAQYQVVSLCLVYLNKHQDDNEIRDGAIKIGKRIINLLILYQNLYQLPKLSLLNNDLIYYLEQTKLFLIALNDTNEIFYDEQMIKKENIKMLAVNQQTPARNESFDEIQIKHFPLFFTNGYPEEHLLKIVKESIVFNKERYATREIKHLFNSFIASGATKYPGVHAMLFEKLIKQKNYNDRLNLEFVDDLEELILKMLLPHDIDQLHTLTKLFINKNISLTRIPELLNSNHQAIVTLFYLKTTVLKLNKKSLTLKELLDIKCDILSSIDAIIPTDNTHPANKKSKLLSLGVFKKSWDEKKYDVKSSILNLVKYKILEIYHANRYNAQLDQTDIASLFAHEKDQYKQIYDLMIHKNMKRVVLKLNDLKSDITDELATLEKTLMQTFIKEKKDAHEESDQSVKIKYSQTS